MCFAPLYNSPYDTLLLVLEIEWQASTTEDSGNGEYEHMKSKNVDPPPACESKNSALLYILAAQKCQQRMDAQLAADGSVVKMFIHFCRSGATWRLPLSYMN